MRHRYRLISCTVALMLATACKDKTPRLGSGPSDRTWSPATLTSVAGVPEAQVESALRARLAGPRPAHIDEHKWGHVHRLYKLYGNNPLWLAPDGLLKERALALTNAVADAENDAVRMDAYPIAELATIATMRPADPDYTGLQKGLIVYRGIVAKGGWPSVPEGKSVKPGEADNPARLSALRARLAAEGITIPRSHLRLPRLRPLLRIPRKSDARNDRRPPGARSLTIH